MGSSVKKPKFGLKVQSSQEKPKFGKSNPKFGSQSTEAKPKFGNSKKPMKKENEMKDKLPNGNAEDSLKHLQSLLEEDSPKKIIQEDSDSSEKFNEDSKKKKDGHRQNKQYRLKKCKRN